MQVITHLPAFVVRVGMKNHVALIGMVRGDHEDAARRQRDAQSARGAQALAVVLWPALKGLPPQSEGQHEGPKNAHSSG